jgi:hypothetical protein
MIGTRAFISDMALPLIWLVISLAVLALIFRPKKVVADRPHTSTMNMKVRGAIAIVVVSLGLVAGAFRLSRQVQNRATLHNLTPTSVDFIQIGNARLEKTSDVNAVVNAFHDSRWYVHTAGDGGWARTVDIEIHLRSGDELHYRVARMLKQDGAVVQFTSQNRGAQFVGHYGYAWVKELPYVLDGIGISLPNEPYNH